MERYYIKDNCDGNEFCLSGDNSFYLIDNTKGTIEDIKKSVLDEIIYKIEELEEAFSEAPIDYGDRKDYIESRLYRIIFGKHCLRCGYSEKEIRKKKLQCDCWGAVGKRHIYK